MKKAILLGALALSGCATYQPFEPTETSSVVYAAGVSKTELYNRSRQWFSEFYNSGKTVIDYEDKEVGTIHGNGAAVTGNDPFGVIEYRIKYSISIDTKPEKSRITIRVNEHTSYSPDQGEYTARNVSESQAMDATYKVADIMTNYENYVKQDRQSDW